MHGAFLGKPSLAVTSSLDWHPMACSASLQQRRVRMLMLVV